MKVKSDIVCDYVEEKSILYPSGEMANNKQTI